ncbi:hypothetical protein FA13DRAFT_313626 [Coprinellus micaceus]|uniref:Uncharacterized protein n=1 Tax=Coprinellus micaceus TaxID=71717 RepID=A0A4Y7SK98_COPMI|nr:hypothetical protein FA13DRAFT_1517341 [Coprinellus micaceus]TEB31890.1 hypothetical protein FA13DRAFT_313626 [Coprinellus micaceus]
MRMPPTEQWSLWGRPPRSGDSIARTPCPPSLPGRRRLQWWNLHWMASFLGGPRLTCRRFAAAIPGMCAPQRRLEVKTRMKRRNSRYQGARNRTRLYMWVVERKMPRRRQAPNGSPARTGEKQMPRQLVSDPATTNPISASTNLVNPIVSGILI